MGKSYSDGWRPPFKHPSGDLAQLIRAMWSEDYRLRPAMKDVVDKLETCVSLDDDGEADTAPLHLPLASLTTEQSLQAVVREQRLEIEKLKARARQKETLEDTERGILGGMYEFVPDRQGSILGRGASAARACLSERLLARIGLSLQTRGVRRPLALCT